MCLTDVLLGRRGACAVVDPYRSAAGSHGSRCCSGYTEGHSHKAGHV